MIAIVTGGGRGIGAATAEVLAINGYDVLITSRNSRELEATCQRVRDVAPAQKIEYTRCDVSQEHEVEKLFARCQDLLGIPDVLINNAAIIKVNSFRDMPVCDWDLIQAVNTRGTMLCCKQAFRYMSRRGGSIVNISSLGGIRSTQKFPGFVAYSTSKAAVVGLTESLAVEGKELGIRVNCVAPGAVQTKMLAEAAPNLQTAVTAADIAKTIHYLADDRLSKHVTGSIWEIFSND